jgi:hypothetical protein
MVQLFDGEKEIKSISVMALFKNSQRYLEFLVKKFEEIEKYYDNVTFSYNFLENNSSDDSRHILQEFIKNRKGKFVTLNLDKTYTCNRTAINIERIHTIKTLRNVLLNTIKPIDSDWTLMIDSDIYFQVETIQEMFKAQPTKNNIAMMSPFTTQIFTDAILRSHIAKNPEKGKSLTALLDKVKKDTKYIDCLHFYDTYATIDAEGIMTYPFCIFEKCLTCRLTRPTDHPLLKTIPEDQDIVEVKSTFGGFVLIDTSILNHRGVEWDTYCVNVDKKTAMCEHVLFCDRIRTVSQKKIVILQNVKNVYRTQ